MTTISGAHVMEVQDLIEQLRQVHPTTKVHIVLLKRKEQQQKYLRRLGQELAESQTFTLI